MQNNFMNGALISPKDNRDYHIATATQSFPYEFTLQIPKTKNQGSVGSCVAHSLSSICEYYYSAENQQYNEFSAGFIYGNRTNIVDKNKGMYPREALDTLCKIGDVPYNNFPYNKEVPEIINLYNVNAEKLIPIAKDYRISAYARVTTIDEIKTSLINGIPITVSYPMFRRAFTPDWNGNLGVPNETDKQDGNHMVTIFGWKHSNKWVILNSWGNLWAKGGIAYIPFEYPLNEAWSVADNTKSPLIIKPKNYWLWDLIYKIAKTIFSTR